METPRPRPDRARSWFFAFIIPLAILLAVGVAQLPKTWQQAAIMFWFVGVPLLVFGLRILRHATDVEVARLGRAAQGPVPSVPRRAVRDDHELHIVQMEKKEGGRVKL